MLSKVAVRGLDSFPLYVTFPHNHIQSCIKNSFGFFVQIRCHLVDMGGPDETRIPGLRGGGLRQPGHLGRRRPPGRHRSGDPRPQRRFHLRQDRRGREQPAQLQDSDERLHQQQPRRVRGPLRRARLGERKIQDEDELNAAATIPII